VYENLSLRVAAGETLALVGGKGIMTTKLLLLRSSMQPLRDKGCRGA
jgi:ABC-type transporter Mla maintaining outer membrane lipid asymmetry ATPase subunit MlaF